MTPFRSCLVLLNTALALAVLGELQLKGGVLTYGIVSTATVPPPSMVSSCIRSPDVEHCLTSWQPTMQHPIESCCAVAGGHKPKPCLYLSCQISAVAVESCMSCHVVQAGTLLLCHVVQSETPSPCHVVQVAAVTTVGLTEGSSHVNWKVFTTHLMWWFTGFLVVLGATYALVAQGQALAPAHSLCPTASAMCSAPLALDRQKNVGLFRQFCLSV